jgi:hypothetical protein
MQCIYRTVGALYLATFIIPHAVQGYHVDLSYSIKCVKNACCDTSWDKRLLLITPQMPKCFAITRCCINTNQCMQGM